MKPFFKIAFCLASAMVAFSAKADTALIGVFSNLLPVKDNSIYGGVIFRDVQYDSTHFRKSIAVAFRITPTGSAALPGIEIDRSEIIARFSRNNAVYGECILRRVFNDNFDDYINVLLAERSPGSTAGETLISSSITSVSGKSRSFISDSTAYSADGLNYQYTPSVGICNLNKIDINLTGAIPSLQVNDTVDIYAINSRGAFQSPLRVGTAQLVGTDI